MVKLEENNNQKHCGYRLIQSQNVEINNIKSQNPDKINQTRDYLNLNNPCQNQRIDKKKIEENSIQITYLDKQLQNMKQNNTGIILKENTGEKFKNNKKIDYQQQNYKIQELLNNPKNQRLEKIYESNQSLKNVHCQEQQKIKNFEKKVLRVFALKFLRTQLNQYCIFNSRIKCFDKFLEFKRNLLKLLNEAQ
ncbi:hypothetical protein PPERSA_06182 [Pseudocohnilembus persalinus]|uniref:Uncharacterized protein n=1 Tax=Pseudocohnilembus persalinus TaxID=266149 RepID=A0A0V0R0H4_PSEPJ|nr:hypothetical protein PPERSA_06182 [Pseudocohnilembus persalinus]|eukprot:KRX08004.1 hypothetical protein PPERSA_06182 [Pseudocohnilembus persalinus]